MLALLRHMQHDPKGKAHPGTAFVFGNPLGEEMTFPKRQWEACVLRAHGHQPKWSGAGKLSAESRETLRTIDLEFHDLRHEHGSRLLEAGWKLHDVRDRLGHTDIATTSTYLNSGVHNQQDAMRRYGTRPAPHVLHDLAPDVPDAPQPPCNNDDAPHAKPSVN